MVVVVVTGGAGGGVRCRIKRFSGRNSAIHSSHSVRGDEMGRKYVSYFHISSEVKWAPDVRITSFESSLMNASSAEDNNFPGECRMRCIAKRLEPKDNNDVRVRCSPSTSIVSCGIVSQDITVINNILLRETPAQRPG